MKNFTIKKLSIGIICFVLVAMFSVREAHAQIGIQDFIIGQDTIPRIGSLLVSSVANETVDSVSVFGKGSAGVKRGDCVNETTPGSQSESCLQVNGLGFLSNLFADVPVSVVGKVGIKVGNSSNTSNATFRTAAEALLVDGGILDWSLARRNVNQVPEPQDTSTLRTVCADDNGKLTVCGEDSTGQPVSWDFDFYFDRANTSTGTYGDNSGYKHHWPTITIGWTPPSAWGSGYGVMIGIDDGGDFDQLECQYSQSPIGYGVSDEFFDRRALGPRDITDMRWEDVTMTNVLDPNVSGSPTFSPNNHIANKRASNGGSARFYTAITIPHIVETDDANILGYTAGTVRCRTKASSGHGAGVWKYQSLVPPYTVDDNSSSNLVSLDIDDTSSTKATLYWQPVLNDTEPSSFYYSVIEYREVTTGVGSSIVPTVVAIYQEEKTYEVTKSCSGLEYAVRVTQCHPEHTDCYMGGATSEIVSSADSSLCTGNSGNTTNNNNNSG